MEMNGRVGVLWEMTGRDREELGGDPKGDNLGPHVSSLHHPRYVKQRAIDSFASMPLEDAIGVDGEIGESSKGVPISNLDRSHIPRGLLEASSRLFKIISRYG